MQRLLPRSFKRSPILLVLTLLLGLSGPLFANVYYSKEEALEIAFGKDSQVESVPLFLTDQQIEVIEKISQTKLEGSLYTLFKGMKGDRILGFAAIESQTVRTQAETLLVVISPSGELVNVEVLAFHEPTEYKPQKLWLEKLFKRPLDQLRAHHGVDAISGATLSVKSTLDQIRKVMAVYKVAIEEAP
ncbi:MAG: FMN-binding protein [Methylococcus sp.]|nr:MAG: FMN-binding protein [Methylococcus sp.]